MIVFHQPFSPQMENDCNYDPISGSPRYISHPPVDVITGYLLLTMALFSQELSKDGSLLTREDVPLPF